MIPVCTSAKRFLTQNGLFRANRTGPYSFWYCSRLFWNGTNTCTVCVQTNRGDDYKEGAAPDLLLLHLRVRPSIPRAGSFFSISSVTAHSVQALCGVAWLG